MPPWAAYDRLNVQEYDNTLRDLLLDDTRPGATQLPEDIAAPFDNDYTFQSPSKSLIQGTETLARDAVDRLVADPARRAEVVGCQPAGADDAQCFEEFITRFGRRAFRRPLDGDEIERFMALRAHSVDRGDFFAGIEVALLAFLQDPNFLYRVEVGEPNPGDDSVVRLTDWELATRLSFLLWETTPDDWLLDEVEASALADAEDVMAIADQMLDDPRAHAAVERFHALWLGYFTTSLPSELRDSMRRESTALIRRVIFEDRAPWQDLLLLDETFVDDALAEHYGLTPPGSSEPQWVAWGDSGRRGLLSQARYLAAGRAVDGDTSPTTRGKLIRNRLMCQTIPPPPPEVDSDILPTDGECKWEQREHLMNGTCGGCHALMDGVGWGLENYDVVGRYRAHDDGRPQCTIDQTGELGGQTFAGPGELADLVLDSGAIGDCLAEHFVRYAVGRNELTEADAPFVQAIAEATADEGFEFRDLLLAYVTDPSFRHRRWEP